MSRDHADFRNTENAKGALGWKKTLPICFFILLSATGITTYIFFTEPSAVRVGATRETAMLVEVASVRRGSYRPAIFALGTVEPSKDIVLGPLVAGEIVEMSPHFEPGGVVEKGRTLLRIDPADFENILRQRKSELRQAVSDLHIEMGRQNVARKDYQFLGETLSGENKALVLREPQLNAAKARVESARAAVAQAELDLGRTSVEAPFDARILSRNVNVGSQVAPGDNLGRLVGLNTYWVETTVPLSKLRWISFPDSPGEKGSPVRVRNRSAWPEGVYRTGYLFRLVGNLEDRTRMARVLVSVEDPMAFRKSSADLPPLMIGEFVEAKIQAREIADVVRLDRDYLRKDDTVWVAKDGKLDIREVKIVFLDARYAYIEDGIEENEQVVVTNLATVVEGARLRVKEPGPGKISGDAARKSASRVVVQGAGPSGERK